MGDWEANWTNWEVHIYTLVTDWILHAGWMNFVNQVRIHCQAAIEPWTLVLPWLKEHWVFPRGEVPMQLEGGPNGEE